MRAVTFATVPEHEVSQASQRIALAISQERNRSDLLDARASAARATGGGLSTEQRRLLVQFQEACRTIGAHDDGAGWAVLGCAIEAELAALDLGMTRVPPKAEATASRARHRDELKKYLARPDAGRGAVGIEKALGTLLVVGEPNQARQEEISTWIAIFDAAIDVTWHATRAPLQLDGMSNVVSPETILTLCGRAVPRHQILRTAHLMPKPANICCMHCGWLDESPGAPARRASR